MAGAGVLCFVDALPGDAEESGEELRAQLLLHGGDMAGERLLRDMQGLGRAGKAALAGKDREVFHRLQIHGILSFTGITCIIHKNLQFYNVILFCYDKASSNRELSGAAGGPSLFFHPARRSLIWI